MSTTSPQSVLALSALDDLRQEGLLAQRLPGYEQRPAQLEMAETVARAIIDGVPAICEAGTGTGKSCAYLIPLIDPLWQTRHHQHGE